MIRPRVCPCCGAWPPRAEPSAAPSVPPTPAWLTDDDPVYRPLDYFALSVLLARLDPAEKLRCCRAYRDRWGEPELRRALDEAARVEPLDPTMAELRRLYHEQQASA